MEKDIRQQLFTEEAIQERVKALGAEITRDYAGKKIVVIALLKGAVFFMTDLVRAIKLPVRVEFMVVSSYDNGTTSSGNIIVQQDIKENIAGAQVIVVDDIIDTGLTLAKVTEMLQTRNPASIKTAVLLDKGSRRVNGLQADYVGFATPDEFVVGYGLDFAQDYRNLPFIGVLEANVYSKK
ncbi:MAG: hypoxanthine phosphoribosyltransferase [Acidaminococcaceae bacterium]